MKSAKENIFLINIKWLKNIFVRIYMLSQYTTKCKYTLKMIQIIEKFNEVLSYILNINDCNISFIIEIFDSCDFTKKSRQVFHSNEHKCVAKKHFVEKLLSFER
jgi:hypothetical protein